MRKDRPYRLTRRAAERLLDGGDVASPGSDPLAVFLAAARGPAGLDELAGEEAAIVAFRGAQSAPAAAVPGLPGRNGAVAKVLYAKIMAVVLAVAAGGVAFAAATGALPGQRPQSSHPPEIQPGTRPTGASDDAPRPATPTAGSTAVPLPIADLCRAYIALPSAEAGKALDGGPFKELVERAGGKDNVAGYCRSSPGSPPDVTPEPTTASPPAVPNAADAAPRQVIDAFSRTLTAETAAGRVRPKEAADLRRILAELRDLVMQGNPDDIRRKAEELHARIDEAVRNQAMEVGPAQRLHAALAPLDELSGQPAAGGLATPRLGG